MSVLHSFELTTSTSEACAVPADRRNHATRRDFCDAADNPSGTDLLPYATAAVTGNASLRMRRFDAGAEDRIALASMVLAVLGMAKPSPVSERVETSCLPVP